MIAAETVDGKRPGLVLLLLGLVRDGPQFYETRLSVPHRRMREVFGRTGIETTADCSIGEHLIDSREDILRGAMRDGEADIPESLGLDDPGIEVTARAVESIGIGALKAEDGLLAVAHDENRSRHFRSRTQAGK